MREQKLPPHFFARMGKKTWSLKRLRFMHRRCASWHAVPLHTPSAVLHKTPFQTCHGVARRAKTAEAFAFANMKQLPSSFHYAAASHFIPLWSIVPVFISLRRGKPFHSTIWSIRFAHIMSSKLLGSAIFSCWRLLTHGWDGPLPDDAENWFAIAFGRLLELSEEGK